MKKILVLSLLVLGATSIKFAYAADDCTFTAKAVYAELRGYVEKGQKQEKEKYTGKTCKVTGEVKSNAKMGGSHEVELVANDTTGTVFLTVKPEASDAVLKIGKGQPITVQCVSTGWMIGPTFKDCVLATSGGATAAAAAPASATTAAPACKEPEKKALASGMKVVGHRQGGQWGVAHIDAITGDQVQVTYADEKKMTQKMAEILPHPEVLYTGGTVPCFKPGDSVVSVWKGATWWDAKIEQINGDQASLTYSDGEKGTHKLVEMVRKP